MVMSSSARAVTVAHRRGPRCRQPTARTAGIVVDRLRVAVHRSTCLGVPGCRPLSPGLLCGGTHRVLPLTRTWVRCAFPRTARVPGVRKGSGRDDGRHTRGPGSPGSVAPAAVGGRCPPRPAGDRGRSHAGPPPGRRRPDRPPGTGAPPGTRHERPARRGEGGQPMRSIWTGTVSFGLVSIPVKLYPATEEKDIRFHQIHANDGGRIRYRRSCLVCGEEVSYDDIAKGYDLGGGEIVALGDEDFADLPLPTSHAIEV